MKNWICMLLALIVFGCQPLTQMPSEEPTPEDARIVSEIQSKMYADPYLSSYGGIHVRSINGYVILSGYLPDQAEVAKLVNIAWKTPGVKKVANDILVYEPGAPRK